MDSASSFGFPKLSGNIYHNNFMVKSHLFKPRGVNGFPGIVVYYFYGHVCDNRYSLMVQRHIDDWTVVNVYYRPSGTGTESVVLKLTGYDDILVKED